MKVRRLHSRQTKTQTPHKEETQPTDFKSKNQTTHTAKPNMTSRQKQERNIFQGGKTPNTHTEHTSSSQKHTQRHNFNTISCRTVPTSHY